MGGDVRIPSVRFRQAMRVFPACNAKRNESQYIFFYVVYSFSYVLLSAARVAAG